MKIEIQPNYEVFVTIHYERQANPIVLNTGATRAMGLDKNYCKIGFESDKQWLVIIPLDEKEENSYKLHPHANVENRRISSTPIRDACQEITGDKGLNRYQAKWINEHNFLVVDLNKKITLS